LVETKQVSEREIVENPAPAIQSVKQVVSGKLIPWSIKFCRKRLKKKKVFFHQAILPAEWVFLYELTLQHKSKNILEIGCYYYTSSLAFLAAMQDLEETQFYCVDILHRFQKYKYPIPEVESRWHRIKGRSQAVVPTLDVKFDLIFIDGQHDKAAVDEDMKNCMERLSDGGVLIIHDVNHAPLRDWLSEHKPRDEWDWYLEEKRSRGLAVWPKGSFKH